MLDSWLRSPEAEQQAAADPILGQLTLGYQPRLTDSWDSVEFQFRISARCLPLSRDASRGSTLSYSLRSAMDYPFAPGGGACWTVKPDQSTLNRALGPITPVGGYTYANGAATNWDGMPTSDPAELLRQKVKQAIRDRDAQGLNRLAWETVGPERKSTAADLDLAMTAASKAAELTSRGDGTILDTLAWVYFRKGEIDSAISVETEAIRVAADWYRADLTETLEFFKAKARAR